MSAPEPAPADAAVPPPMAWRGYSLLVAITVGYPAVLLGWLALVQQRGAAACGDGQWFPAVRPVLLYVTGVPLAGLVAALLTYRRTARLESQRQALVYGVAGLVISGLLSVLFAWTYQAGVCVRAERVTAHSMTGAAAVETARLAGGVMASGAIDSVTLRTPERSISVTLRAGAGMGGAVDPDGLSAALRQVADQAGLRRPAPGLGDPSLPERLLEPLRDGGR